MNSLIALEISLEINKSNVILVLNLVGCFEKLMCTFIKSCVFIFEGTQCACKSF